MRALRRVVIASLAGITLSACAQGSPITRQVVVSGTEFEGIRGEASLNVRSFVVEAGESYEVLGATCDVTSSLFDAQLLTPARLVVPNFGPQSPELRFDCIAGDRRGTTSARIVTRWRYPPGYGFPAYGPYPYGLRGYGWGWQQPAYPVSSYPDVRAELR